MIQKGNYEMQQPIVIKNDAANKESMFTIVIQQDYEHIYDTSNSFLPYSILLTPNRAITG